MSTRRIAALAAATLGATALAGVPGRSLAVDLPLTEKRQAFYVVQAHTDDEIDGWSMIEGRSPDDYLVFVVMTHGRTTEACHTAKEADQGWDPYWNLTFVEGMGYVSDPENPPKRSGPYRYQGPGSPVREPDLGERKPFGDPWVGMGSEGCGDARIASWHWFLDDMSVLTPTVASMDVGRDPWADDDFQGEFCPPGRKWDRDRRKELSPTGCAEVWADANSARIVLDLPEMTGYDPPEPIPPVRFTPADVVAALDVVRSKRAAWGIPVLPERGILSVSHYADGFPEDGAWPGCRNWAHPEHKAVSDAVRYHDLDIGPQYGAAICDEDAYLVGAEDVVVPPNPATIVASNLVVFVEGAERRVGPYVKNYGWLMATYGFAASNTHYWRVPE